MFLPLASLQAKAQSYNSTLGRPCSVENNRLAPDTNQFLGDCGYAAWCDPSSNTCKKNGCRKDEYPFGMGPKAVSSKDLAELRVRGEEWPDKFRLAIHELLCVLEF